MYLVNAKSEANAPLHLRILRDYRSPDPHEYTRGFCVGSNEFLRPLYSIRNALAGSIEAARRAGISPARQAAKARIKIEPASTAASTLFTS